MVRRGLHVLAAVALLAACDDGTTGPERGRSVSFDFSQSAQGWTGDFADYRVGDDLDLRSGFEPLPDPLAQEGGGFLLVGTNTSDDLFMYLKEDVDGLQPDTTYAVDMTVSFATSVPSGCAGIGGSPGSSVWVKAGASEVEPVPVQEGEFWRMNVDKGGQSTGGEAAVVVGDVANSVQDCGEPMWEIKTLSTEESELTARTGADGTLWLFVGVDSGFEGTTRLYFTSVEAELTPL